MTKKCVRCKNIAWMEQYTNKTCLEVFGERDIDCYLTWTLNVGTKHEKDMGCRCFSENEINKVREVPCTCLPSKDIWMTISPTQDTEFSKFQKCINKFMKSKTILTKSWHCFEWRHNDSENNGLHVHIWLKPADLRRLKWHIKGLKKRYSNWLFKIYDPCFYDEIDKLNYCIGNTYEDDKSDKKKKDIDLRKKYRVDNIIYKK